MESELESDVPVEPGSAVETVVMTWTEPADEVVNTEVTNEPVDAGLDVTDDPPPDVPPEDPPDVWSSGGLCVSNLPFVFLFVCFFIVFFMHE